MNILKKLSVRQIKLNKNRSIAALLGIILSAAMITAVLSMLFSSYRYLYNVTAEENGNWHLFMQHVSDEGLQEIKEDPLFSEAACIDAQGYSRLEDIENEDKPYLYLIDCDEKCYEMQQLRLVEGHFPAAEGEIALPQNFYTDDNQPWKIGEKRRLEISVRESGGQVLDQNTPYIRPEENVSGDPEDDEGEIPAEEAEVLKPFMSKTFTLTGIYEAPVYFRLDAYNTPGYAAIISPEDAQNKDHMVFLRLQEPKDVYEAEAKYSEWACEANSDLLMFYGVHSMGGFTAFLISSAAVLLLIIFLGAAALIYNAFAISVTERTKQFGLLASAGASSRQIHNTVLYESFILALLGIPAGIAAGLGGIALTLYLIRRFIGRLTPHQTVLKLYITPWVLLLAAALSLAVILISAHIPAKRAGRVMPIEAIRRQKDYHFKDVKTAAFHQKLFGAEGLLAAKYFKRSRRRYFAAIAALAMGITIFVSSTYFTSELMNKADLGFRRRGSDLLYQPREEEQQSIDAETFCLKLLELPSVEDVSYACTVRLPLLTAADDLSEDAFNYEAARKDKDGKAVSSCELIFLPEKSYRAYAEESKFSRKRETSEELPEAIVKNESRIRAGEEGHERFQEIRLFKEKSNTAEILIPAERPGMRFHTIYQDTDGIFRIEYLTDDAALRDEEDPEAAAFISEQKPFRIVHKTSAGPSETDSRIDYAAVFPLSDLPRLLPGGMDYPLLNKEFYLYAEAHEKARAEVLELLREEGLKSSGVYDLTASYQMHRARLVTIRVMAIGFVSLISLVAVVNVLNTITTNMKVRKRDFALLRSAGASPSGIRRMLFYECLQYGIRAAGAGLAASLFFTFLIHRSISNIYSDAFRFPFGLWLAAAAFTFVLVLLTMLYGSRRLREIPVAEALQTEIT